MFLLEGLFLPVAITALVTAVTLLALFAVVYAVLRAKGRILIRAKRPRSKSSTKKEAAPTESEETLPEEVLLAILTAAAVACGEIEKKRFRVVSFRRMK